jgi:UDP-glucose 4-epimerase
MSATKLPVVVTGGAGFLGQNVVRYLTQQGLECFVVDCKEPTAPELVRAVKAGKVKLVVVDLQDSSAVAGCVAKLPTKFHLVQLAAVIETITEVTDKTPATLGYHVGISMNVAEGWRDRLLSMCYISSWEVYGVPKRLPLHEGHETQPFNVYGVGKFMAENYLRVFCNSLGIPLTILRLSHIYGPGEWHNKAIPNFIKNCIGGVSHKLFGGGKDLREFVHVRDIARAIELSFGRTENGIFNIAGGRALTVRQTLDLIETLFNVNLPVEELPADRPPLDLSFDLSHAKRVLGYEPQVTLEDGLREEIEWFRSMGTTAEH